MKKHNFSAGPSALADVVIEKTVEAIQNFKGSGISILSISHRTKDFEAILTDAKALMRELLHIPDNYEILFLAGGASTRFYEIPANFLGTKAAFVNTGVWAKKAIKEAKFYGEAEIIATSEDRNFCYIPKSYTIPQDVDYLHITSNNTIYGTQYKVDIDSPVPLIADMSSDIASRPIDIEKYAMIYGGAQKNLGAAGVTFLIISKELLEKVVRPLPSMLTYSNHINNDSMFNTPPVVSIYTVYETLTWLKSIGGVEAVQKLNEEKAAMLYSEIERNPMFKGTADVEDRSVMNICFVMNDGYEDLAPEFLKFATERGMYGVKGHRLVGGFRASCYNAVPKQSVEALIAVMQEFEKMHVK